MTEKGIPPLCHPRRLSPTPVPDLIGDPIKEWIQSSKGSSVVVFFLLTRPKNQDWIPAFAGMTEGEQE